MLSILFKYSDWEDMNIIKFIIEFLPDDSQDKIVLRLVEFC